MASILDTILLEADNAAIAYLQANEASLVAMADAEAVKLAADLKGVVDAAVADSKLPAIFKGTVQSIADQLLAPVESDAASAGQSIFNFVLARLQAEAKSL